MDEIGAQLREARMRAKIDINEMETRTKIRAKYLRAMENEEWDLLPGEVYARTFLRTYADFLGLDSRALLDEFRRRYENPDDHEPPPIALASRERDRDRRSPRLRVGVPPWLVVGVVLVAVAVVLYLVGTSGNSAHDDTTAAHTSRVTTTHTSTRAATSTTHSTTTPAAARVVRLSLVPTGQVYVCLVNGAGHVLIPGRTYDTGETIPVQTAGKLLLTLGNASITLKANGVAVPVVASASAIGLRFTPTGHTTLAAAQQPTCT